MQQAVLRLVELLPKDDSRFLFSPAAFFIFFIFFFNYYYLWLFIYAKGASIPSFTVKVVKQVWLQCSRMLSFCFSVLGWALVLCFPLSHKLLCSFPWSAFVIASADLITVSGCRFSSSDLASVFRIFSMSI